MPKKKPTKKSKTAKKTAAKQKSRSVTAKPKAQILVYSCDGHCSVSDSEIHLDKNSTLYMFALGTDVTLTFPAPSPFKSGKAETIKIASNTFESRVISNKPETFSYSFDCEECPSGTDDGTIIVDPGPGGGR